MVGVKMNNTKLSEIDRSPKGGPVWFSNQWMTFNPSEYKSQYGLHKLSHKKNFSPELKYENPPNPFNDTSEYRDNYFLDKRRYTNNFIRRLDQIQLSKSPMESISNYSNEFIKKQTEKSIPMKHPRSQLDFLFQTNKNNIHHNSSVYKNDFQIADININAKNLEKNNVSTINNQGAPTDYQENFQLKPPSRIYMSYPSCKKADVAFATETDYNSTFVKHPFVKSQIIVPLQSNISIEKMPFSKDSLYQSDFIGKERAKGLCFANNCQNPSSVMQLVQADKWYDKFPGQIFQDHSEGIFYRK